MSRNRVASPVLLALALALSVEVGSADSKAAQGISTLVRLYLTFCTPQPGALCQHRPVWVATARSRLSLPLLHLIGCS
ncbi:hypothetical protein EDB85DRAFT_1932115 [Lactarius pseudohatsudake]|nr:hypothetical protein EDB85DRAFT_1932115 [Lactarius pseudohatsudake]